MARVVLMGLFSVLLFASAARAELLGRSVNYYDGKTVLQGYFVYDPARPKPLPGVVIYHEWWGQTDYIRRRARELAELGYAVLAADMYGQARTTEEPAIARKWTRVFYENRALMRRRAALALDTLSAQTYVNSQRLAAIGYCLGGTVALELARSGADIAGAVSIHGGLSTPMPAGQGEVKASVLALNGAADTTVTHEDRLAITREMTLAAPWFRMVEYPGARHAFTNPEATETGEKHNLPTAYSAEADAASFADMHSFLYNILEK